MKYTPICIKCRKKYDSDEPDDYYCSACVEEKDRIAKEIDITLAGRPKKKIISGLAHYDAINKGGFVNAKDLGI